MAAAECSLPDEGGECRERSLTSSHRGHAHYNCSRGWIGLRCTWRQPRSYFLPFIHCFFLSRHQAIGPSVQAEDFRLRTNCPQFFCWSRFCCVVYGTKFREGAKPSPL